MTNPNKNVEILTTLTEDPYVSYFPWQLDVHDSASRLAKCGGTKRGECKGRLIRGGFGGAEIFSYKV